jgi:hypothetical protein
MSVKLRTGLMSQRTDEEGRTWFLFEYADGWLIALRLAKQQGTAVVAEIHLARGDVFKGPSLEDTDLPPGGLSARRLQGVRLGEVLAALRERARFDRKLKDLGSFFFTNSLGLSVEDLTPPRRTGRKGHPERYYAEWALAYVELLSAGVEWPIKDLAAGRGYSEATVRGVINRARKLGLLTPSPPGKAGGELTSRATALLGIKRKRRRQR